MLDFRLRGVSTDTERRLPPSLIYRIDGPDLLGIDGQPIARHTAGSWWANDMCYTSLYSESPCTIHFENADGRSQAFGPYDQVQLADGMLRGGTNPAELMAMLIDAFRQWVLRSDGSIWQRVVLSAPTA